MSDPVFFRPERTLTLSEVLEITGAMPAGPIAPDLIIEGIAPLDAAGPGDLSFLDNAHYIAQLETTRAAAVLTGERFLRRASPDKPILLAAEPYRAFAQVAAALFPSATRPGSFFAVTGIAPGASVHPEARLEAGVTVDPGAVIGPDVEIGTGSVIGAHAVIGPGVRIGRQCSIGPNSTLQNCLVGNRVIIHPGAQIGQDGFGFAMGPRGHFKVPQIGRVVIQDDVEIGACTTIDRGASRDTVVGEGTKIDNQVQIAHNVTIGRHCVIVAKAGIAGSTILEDFVVMGGASSSVGHVRIGRGAQIAGAASVKDDVPPGARMGGTPARPLKQWARELAALKKLAAPKASDAEERKDHD